jgi:xanthine dehydrogenase YagR molybdenum-binding subunit
VADDGQVPEVQAPAKPTAHPKYAWPEERKLLGGRVRRVDGPVKARGAAKYSYDIKRPGMLYGRILRSPHAHARVRSVNLGAAERMPGVEAALVIAEPGRILMYQGDEVAAVAAVSELVAADALRAIRVEYEVPPHVATIERAMSPSAPAVFEGGNVRAGAAEEHGELDAGFEAAAHVVEATYSTQVQTHVSLETHGCVCEWNGDSLIAWVSTQAVHGTREGFAKALGIEQAKVRVITEHMGGGFGSKFGPDVQGIVCARLAQKANAPVKLMLDRKEEHLATGNCPSAFARIRAGVSADGVVTAFDAETWGTGGAGQDAGFPLPYIYQFPNRRRRHEDVFTNAGPQRAMRAPGHPQGCFITEVLLDELADGLRMDPVELRIRNLPAEAPNAMWRRYFPMAAARFGWERRHGPGDPAPGPIKRGFGCAANQWGGGGRGTRAQCEILPDGGVVVRCGTQDLGVGTRTLVAIVAAETLGLPIEAVRAEIGDSQYPFSGGSGGSTTAPSVAPAIRLADLAVHEAAQAMYPALTKAAGEVGTPQIRNAGTVGGNLCQRPRCWYFRNEEFHCLKKGGPRCYAVDGENQFHAIFGGGPCHIVHPSSLAVPLVAFGAHLRVVGPSGERDVPAGDFFVLPERRLMYETVLEPNELVTHATLPRLANTRSATCEVRYKQAFDWPIAFATAVLTMNGSRIERARVVMGAVAPIPWRSAAAENALEGQTPGEEAAERAAAAAVQEAEPMTAHVHALVPEVRGCRCPIRTRPGSAARTTPRPTGARAPRRASAPTASRCTRTAAGRGQGAAAAWIERR